MTAIFFQNEHKRMNKHQQNSKDKSVYYSDDYSTIKEVPDHRLLYRKTVEIDKKDEESKTKKLNTSEREVMISPNNMDFFYAAEETSEKIWQIDEKLNRVFVWLSRVMFTTGFILFAWHIKKQKDMREAAFQVSTRIEKEGAKASLYENRNVVVYMDGKM